MRSNPIRRIAFIAAGGAVAAVLTAGTGTVVMADADAALPISCTGYPIDQFTTCATSGQNGIGNAGDGAGGDTPNLGGGGGGGTVL